MKRLMYLMLWGLVSFSARADVAVLVHGYLGSASSWERSGIAAVLSQQGWQPAGVFTPGGLIPLQGAQSDNRFYTVELPSQAPIGVQARILSGMLQTIERRQPDEPLILVGHSAGGVVARMALVEGGAPGTKALITLASPHLGTLRAVEALDETDDPFPICLIKDFFAGDLYDVVRDSWGVLLDLTPERPGNLLFWLNRQAHPDVQYISVVRSGPVGMGDELVPAYSQDMNHVAALQGRSETRVTPVSHSLNPMDGSLLAEILNSL
ncbi:MAG: alpha/beta fold hydrolase [Candidatus Thiodiazotropha sp.]